MRYAVIVALAIGCGRIGFDPAGDGVGLDGDGGIGGSGSGSGTNPDAPSQLAGLIAWWKLDDASGTVARDSIGTAHGTLVATNALPIWTVGRRGGALAFVGDGDRVAIGTPPALANLPGVTISAWINPTSVASSGGGRCVFDKSTTTTGWLLLVARSSSGSVTFEGQRSSSAVGRRSASGLLQVGRWTHVVGTWNGGIDAADVRIFVDNSETMYSGSFGGGGTRGDDSAVVAEINCAAGAGLAGMIDDVKIFNRALSAAEVAQLFAE